jgi:[ribosomal protein S5]-alanine N-acetyltransferase
MPELQRLRADHAAAVLAFESANRAFFATTISDRGDEYFEKFADRHDALLAEQDAGMGAYYVLVADDGTLLGRFNLVFIGEGSTAVGYRVAQHVTGRGIATASLRALCSLAASKHGVRTLRAATSRKNVASQRVLLNSGFIEVGPAEPSDIGGKQGSWYQLDVAHTSPGGT